MEKLRYLWFMSTAYTSPLFLLIFCQPNYKMVFDVLILMYSKKKNDLIRFCYELSNIQFC